MDNNYVKSRLLIKESTSLKNSDISRAIQLIEQAIQICPENIIDDKLKLSSYYNLANNKEKAYGVLFNLIDEIDKSSSILSKNVKKVNVYEKLCTLCYSDMRFTDYIYYYSIKRYNTNLAIFNQGRLDDYNRIYETFDLFGLSFSSKINACFKKINKQKEITIFGNRFVEFFNDHKQELITILEKTHSAISSKEYDLKILESIEEKAERILNSDFDFMKMSQKYTDAYFTRYYNDKLKPII